MPTAVNYRWDLLQSTRGLMALETALRHDAVLLLQWLHYRDRVSGTQPPTDPSPTSPWPYDARVSREATSEFSGIEGAKRFRSAVDAIVTLGFADAGAGQLRLRPQARVLTYDLIEFRTHWSGEQLAPLVHRVASPVPERLLDIGCGAGQSLASLEASFGSTELVGVEFDPQHLALAPVIRQLFDLGPSKARLTCADAHALPFADSAFDLVLFKESSFYLNRRRWVREASRVLRPGGRIAVMTIGLSYPLRRMRAGWRRGTLDRAAAMMLANGILVHTTGRQVSWRGRSQHFETVGGLGRAVRHIGFEVEYSGYLTTPYNLHRAILFVAKR